jgi:hypothetical protein
MCDDQVMNGRPLGLYCHSGHETKLLKREQDDFKNCHNSSTGLFSRLVKKFHFCGFHDPTDPGTTVLSFHVKKCHVSYSDQGERNMIDRHITKKE